MTMSLHISGDNSTQVSGIATHNEQEQSARGNLADVVSTLFTFLKDAETHPASIAVPGTEQPNRIVGEVEGPAVIDSEGIHVVTPPPEEPPQEVFYTAR